MSGQQDIFELFCELVRIDSPTGDESQMREALQKKLEALGVETEVDAAGNLRGFLPGDPESTQDAKLFSSHMDTVEPGRNICIILDDDGRIHTDGTTILGADDKDGITAILLFLTKEHGVYPMMLRLKQNGLLTLIQDIR